MAIVGTQKFSSAIGLVLLLEAIAVLIGPPPEGECWWGVRGGGGAAAFPPWAWLGPWAVSTPALPGRGLTWGALSWKASTTAPPLSSQVTMYLCTWAADLSGEHSLLHIPGPAWFHCGKKPMG